MIKSTHLFQNGMVMTFGEDGEQIPDLQGPYSSILHKKLIELSDENTEWWGWNGRPMVWNPLTTGD
jgi:hypothetical protein